MFVPISAQEKAEMAKRRAAFLKGPEQNRKTLKSWVLCSKSASGNAKRKLDFDLKTDVKKPKLLEEIVLEPVKINFYRSKAESIFVIVNGFKITAEKEQRIILKGNFEPCSLLPLLTAISNNTSLRIAIGEKIPLQHYETKYAEGYKMLSICE